MTKKQNAYEGTTDYIVSDELRQTVNAALAIGRPLLLKGEPGTGKTLLATSIATALGRPLLRWNIKSTTKAQEGLYVYDTVARLNDSRFGDGDVKDIKRYIKLGVLGQAFASKNPVIVLIDEIDKADIEFPNDLLAEIDEMRFTIHETGEEIRAVDRPIVLITSNSEKELPDAFLRRRLFHYIDFPDKVMMEKIVQVHFPDIDRKLMDHAIKKFYQIRAVRGLRKQPSTSELIDWIKVLVAMGARPEDLEKQNPFLACLIKKDEDLAQIPAVSRAVN